MTNSVTTNGVTVTSDQTPEERFNAISKSMGGAEAAKPEQIVFGPTGPIDSTVAELARHDASVAAQAPQVDESAIAALNSIYRGLPPAEREVKRPVYERDLASIFSGRKLGESLSAWTARKTAPAPAATPTPSTTVPPQGTPAERAAGTDASEIKETSGYTLPAGKYADVRDLVDGLKIARKRGWSQAQVDKIIKETWS